MRAQLVQVDNSAVTIPLPVGEEVTFGRKPTNKFITDHIMCSSSHCVVQFDGNAVFLIDFSSNGTFLNGQRVIRGLKQALNHGDVIELGRLTDVRSPFIFSLDSAFLPAASMEIRSLASKDLELSVLRVKNESLETKVKATLENVAALSYALSQHQRSEQELGLRLEHANQAMASCNAELAAANATIQSLKIALNEQRGIKETLESQLANVVHTLTPLLQGIHSIPATAGVVDSKRMSMPKTQMDQNLFINDDQDEFVDTSRKSLSQMDVSQNENSLFGPNPPSFIQADEREDSEPDDIMDVLQIGSH
jgi:pSer/pThr/pTyr-binding forkhead associated (FHA) protein